MSLGNYEKVMLSSAIVPSHYDLELTPDLDECNFSCNESITFSIKESNIRAITLHSKEIQVKFGR